MIRGIWDRETVASLILVSLLPVAVAWGLDEGIGGLSRLLYVLAIAAGWQALWMVLRAQPPSLAGLVTAFAIAVLAPEDLGPVQLFLGASFGIVMAELAFGGWGRNVVNPATVALAFLAFGFPAAPWPDLPVQIGWAAAASLGLGVILGVLSLELILGAVLVLGAAALGGLELSGTATGILVVFALLVTDPVASSATLGGRWANGALYGALAVMFTLAWGDADPLQLSVAAALLASLAAPLLDEIAITLWLLKRRRRLE